MPYSKGEPFIQAFFDENGEPLALGTIEFFLWNTSTPTPVYSDATGTSIGTTVTLGNNGEPTNSGTPVDLYFDIAITYKIVRKDASGTPISPTIGPYYGIGEAGSGGVALSIDAVDSGASNSLYDYIGVSDGQQVTVAGYYTPGDSGGGAFYWNDTDAGADDGGMTILPTGHVGNGRWIRIIDQHVTPQMFGAKADLTSNDAGLINRANDYAAANDLELKIYGTYYTQDTITFTAKRIDADCEIKHLLADEPCVEFDGDRLSVTGSIYTYNSTKPTTETNAVGFNFKDVLHSNFACRLSCDRVYNGFRNDKTAPLYGLSWHNFFSHWYCRDFVTRAINWDFPGTGANTENFVAACYINGKEWNSSSLSAVVAPVVFLNNCEGFTFGTLNVEWCELTILGDWIRCVNETTLVVGALHFEGNECNSTGDSAIFRPYNAANKPVNIDVRNLNLNGNVQTLGRWFLVELQGGAAGMQGTTKIGGISGNPASNTFTDFRVVLADGTDKHTVRLEDRYGYADYFTDNGAGTIDATTYHPALWIDNQPYTFDADIDLGAAGATEVDLKEAYYITLVTTTPTAIDTISATRKVEEYTRMITVYNNTGASSSLASGGNINFGAHTAPVTWKQGRHAHFIYDHLINKCLFLGLSNDP